MLVVTLRWVLVVTLWHSFGHLGVFRVGLVSLVKPLVVVAVASRDHGCTILGLSNLKLALSNTLFGLVAVLRAENPVNRVFPFASAYSGANLVCDATEVQLVNSSWGTVRHRLVEVGLQLLLVRDRVFSYLVQRASVASRPVNVVIHQIRVLSDRNAVRIFFRRRSGPLRRFVPLSLHGNGRKGHV